MKVFTTKNISIMGAATLFVAVFVYLGFTRPPFPRVYFEGTHVACLPQQDNFAVQWKMHLKIIVDGVEEAVPANIGNTMRCTSELHTHQGNGEISVELYDESRVSRLTFADFFTIWNTPVEREGYTLRVLFDGQDVSSVNDIPLKDGSTVELQYTKEVDAEQKDDEGKG